MAVTLCLSPWPAKGTQGETAAINHLRVCCGGRFTSPQRSFVKDNPEMQAHLDEQHAEAVKVSEAAARALGIVAAARVEREAPGAPQEIKNEAVIRYAGYLTQSDFGGIVSEEIGPRKITYTVNHQRMWQRCGAASILAPWKPLHAARVANASEGG